jgi:hypothetical protein
VSWARVAAALTCLSVMAGGTSCSRFGPVYPSRPEPSIGPAVADPEPARVVVHLAVTAPALLSAIDGSVPRSGDGTFPLLGADRRYTWQRGPFDVGFSQGRVVLKTKVHATVAVPLKTIDVSIDLRVDAEPIVSSEYAVRLQSVDVRVASSETSVSLADRIAGIYEKIETPIAAQLKDFAYDLKPLLSEAYARVTRPIELTMGDATGCAQLRVLEVEAAPTVLADGIEKDLALVVSPSVTFPCVDAGAASPLPPLSNVAALVPGPFTVTIPIAARYDELTRAMTAAFTDGRLYFSREYPGLYLETPELYESRTDLVLKLHIRGPVHGLGIDADLDGDLYLVGHPAVVDNELRVPDLEPTIETRNLLLSLKAMTDGDRIRDEVRQALRLDIGQRLRDVTGKLGAGVTFRRADGCFKGNVDRVEVTGVHAHAAYLRVYVAVTARARVIVPCHVELDAPGEG